jgi:hypothetical protein
MKKHAYLSKISRAIRLFGMALLGLLGLASSTFAQFKVDVAGIGLTQVPIAIAPFKGEDTASQKPSNIVLADLERSGSVQGNFFAWHVHGRVDSSRFLADASKKRRCACFG